MLWSGGSFTPLAVLGGVLLLLCQAPTAAGAEGASSPRPDVVYVALALNYHSIGGDSFDGKSYFPTGPGSFALPKPDPAPSVSVAVGVRREWYAIQASYSQSEHDADWLGAPMGVTHHVLGIEVKSLFRRLDRLRPYVLAGIGRHTLTADGAFHPEAQERTDSAEATYSGFGWTAGFGADYDLSTHVVLTARVACHVCFFQQASSEAPTRPEVSIDDRTESGLDAGVGVRFMWAL